MNNYESADICTSYKQTPQIQVQVKELMTGSVLDYRALTTFLNFLLQFATVEPSCDHMQIFRTRKISIII
jgi:hypothetical protein